jgi:hypothetical protein
MDIRARINFPTRFEALCEVVGGIYWPRGINSEPRPTAAQALADMESLASKALAIDPAESAYEAAANQLAFLESASNCSLRTLKTQLDPKINAAAKQVLLAAEQAEAALAGCGLPRLKAGSTYEGVIGSLSRRMAIFFARAIHKWDRALTWEMFHLIEHAESWIWLTGEYPRYEHLSDGSTTIQGRIDQTLRWERLRKQNKWRRSSCPSPMPQRQPVKLFHRVQDGYALLSGCWEMPWLEAMKSISGHKAFSDGTILIPVAALSHAKKKARELYGAEIQADSNITLVVRVGLFEHTGHDGLTKLVRKAFARSRDGREWRPDRLPGGWCPIDHSESGKLLPWSAARVATTAGRAQPLMREYPWAFFKSSETLVEP